MGQPVLRIHGVCGLLDRPRCVREHHVLLHGPDRLEPQKDRSHQHRADDPAVAAVRARFQCLVRLPAVRRRLERARPRGLPRVQHLAAARFAGLPAVLHLSLRLGMEELPQGS